LHCRRTSTYNAKDQLDSLTPEGQAAISMTYTDAGQFKRVTRGSTTFTNSALGVTREDATSYTVDPDGFVLGQRSPSRLYFLHDGLGSVVATANEGGSESLIARYDPFGGCLANCPAVPYRWLGGLGVYFDDAPIGLYKMGTRYYDPSLGRFTQVDPVEGGSANRYDYAAQDPMNNFDPSGTFCWWNCGKEEARRAVKSGARWTWRNGPRAGKAVHRGVVEAGKFAWTSGPKISRAIRREAVTFYRSRGGKVAVGCLTGAAGAYKAVRWFPAIYVGPYGWVTGGLIVFGGCVAGGAGLPVDEVP
jgi:RHS repeat-associated protein